METVLIPLVEKFSRSRLTAIGDLASGSLQDSPLSENQAGNTFASHRQLYGMQKQPDLHPRVCQVQLTCRCLTATTTQAR